VATFVSDVTIPDNSVIAPGQTFDKTWRMRNRGTCTWGAGYTFAFESGQAMTTNTSIQVPTTAPVATADLTVPMTAPTTTGPVQGFWQLRNPSGTPFGPRVWVLAQVSGGPAPAPPAGPTSAPCTDVATFVADVTIPDNAVVAPGQTFNKTWRLRNRGTCNWGDGYTFVFESGQAMTNITSMPVPATAPNATADLTVPMTAPTTTGPVQGFWQLRSPAGTVFGPRVWVLIQVGSGPAAAPPLAPGGQGQPAAAPPLVPTGVNLDDPARAFRIGSAVPTLAPGRAYWVLFSYDNAEEALPRPTVTVQLLNGASNGLTFDVHSPETVTGDWSGNVPIGRGTTEVLTNCREGDVNIGKCTTGNLSWTGGFGLSGTYYVRVINPTNSTVTPQLVFSGPGLTQCLPGREGSSPAMNQNLPFARVQC
jgi:hypothetical protein